MASPLQGWLPPSREHYELILTVFKFSFPFIGQLPNLINWYGMGKTSVKSRLNVPGRIGWILMEAPGFIILSYLVWKMPLEQEIDVLPWQNLVLAGLFVIHYLYRAIAYPFMQPSLSPLHILVVLFALWWQVMNGIVMGSWLAAYGPVHEEDWSTASTVRFIAGITIWWLGLSGNFFHDEELRAIRRKEQKRLDTLARESVDGKREGTVEKHYRIPQAGLFRYVLYAHYLCEWVEWFGFYMACGWTSVPARTFLINEICVMLPRAWKGRKWYIEKFGEHKIGKRKAVIPGVI